MFAAAAFAAPAAPAAGLNVTKAVTAFDGAELYPQVGTVGFCSTVPSRPCMGPPRWRSLAPRC